MSDEPRELPELLDRIYRTVQLCPSAERTTLNILLGELRSALAQSRAQDSGGEAAKLSAQAIEAGWRETFSTENPFCPCNLKSFTKAVRWAERTAAEQPAKGEGDSRIDAWRDSGGRPENWDAVDEALLCWYGHPVTFSQGERQRFYDAIQKYLKSTPPSAEGDAATIRAQREFFDKHALGPKSAPSCLCCGRSMQGLQPAIQHGELPAIVICERCRDAALSSTEPQAGVVDALLNLQPMKHRNDATRLWQLFASAEEAKTEVNAALAPATAEGGVP